VLDEAAADDLPAEIQLVREGEECDAIVGHAPPENLARWMESLRPGGRLILAWSAEPETLLAALTEAGCIHCLVEVNDDTTLYRGERPPIGASIHRVQSLADSPLPAGRSETGLGVRERFPFLFLLIHQTPNKPAWKLAPGEKIEWRAVTVIDAATGQPTLLAFSSLVNAVAFMQAAVLANVITGVSKVGKFRAEAAQAWPRPLTLNPSFDRMRDTAPGPLMEVDPRTAITSEE
jgi:hypothetical protein